MGIDRPNYTQIPNIFIDKWMRILSKEAVIILFAICRKTIGAQRGTSKISQSKLLEITPIKSVNGVKKAITELIGYKLIIVNQTGKGKNTKTIFKINMK